MNYSGAITIRPGRQLSSSTKFQPRSLSNTNLEFDLKLVKNCLFRENVICSRLKATWEKNLTYNTDNYQDLTVEFPEPLC